MHTAVADHQVEEAGTTDVSLESIKRFERLAVGDGDKNIDPRLHVLIVDADSTDVR